MATLQAINGIYHIRFRFGGKPFRRSLGTANSDEAETIKKEVDVHLSRINVGVIAPPSEDADVVQYVLTGGKMWQSRKFWHRLHRPWRRC